MKGVKGATGQVKDMKKILYLFILFVTLVGVWQCSMAWATRLTLLKDIDVVTSVDSTRIELRFSGITQERNITYRENFLQIEFPNTYINPPKQWIKVEDKLVKEIFVYQYDATTVKARIFAVGRVDDLKDKIRFLKEGNKIIIKYDITSKTEKSSAELVGTSTKDDENVIPAKAIIQSDRPSLDSRFRGNDNGLETFSDKTSMSPRVTKGDENPPPLMGGGEGEGEKGEGEQKEFSDEKEDKAMMPVTPAYPDIHSSILKMIFALSIVLALLLIGLYIFKKILGKKIGITGQSESIRVITNAYLGPKKSIALIDVSGERIVVGITPNHISMLTRLSREGEFGKILKEQIASDEKVELHDELWEKV